ncbi:MAG: recombinase RecA [Firmicutes bacterium]|nr:recombinase RecA [Bacillota bacterium]
MSQDPNKLKALELTLAQIEKNFGKGSIMRLGEASTKLEIDVIPTGSLSLDIALGVGGIPRGRVTEIFGPESSGKTTLALQIIAETQKMGGIAAFIDVEHALDPEYSRNIGVDIENLFVSQPDTGEQALDIVESLVRSNALDIIVIDSVAALVPAAEIEGEMGDMQVGLQARLMSKALRKLTSVISKTKTATIFINQIREKIGVMFGPTETTPGGRSLKFYCSVRLDVRRQDAIKQGGDTIGNRVKVKVVKNKVAPPFKQADFDILFGRGISREGSIIEAGLEYAIVKRSGSYYSYGDVKLGQGVDNTRTFLETHPEITAEITAKVIEATGIPALQRRLGKNGIPVSAGASTEAADA